jgi:hypothetical protein
MKMNGEEMGGDDEQRLDAEEMGGDEEQRLEVATALDSKNK